MLNAFFQLIEPDPEHKYLKRDKQQNSQSQGPSRKIGTNTDEKQKFKTSTIEEDKNNSDESEVNSSFSSSSSTQSLYKDDNDDLIHNQKKVHQDMKTLFNEVNPDEIVNVLTNFNNKNVQRSASEIALLQQALIHNTFFRKIRKKITHNLYQELFQEIHLEEFRPLETVFKHGEPSNKFYIILSGEVCILTPLQRTADDSGTAQPDQHSAPPQIPLPLPLDSSPVSSTPNHASRLSTLELKSMNIQPKLSLTGSASPSSPASIQRTNETTRPAEQSRFSLKVNQIQQRTESIQQISPQQPPASQPQRNLSIFEQSFVDPSIALHRIANQYPNCVIIKRLGTGNSFGEIGLYMDKARTATVVCKTNCEMAVLSKAAFQRILGSFFLTINEDKQQFFKRIPLFQGYSFSFMANLIMNVRRRVYKYGDFIYEEGSSKKRLYFILSGEVELSKKVTLNPTQQVSQIAAGKPDRIVVSQKRANEWFGEVEIMQKIPRFTRARCISTKLEVYHISSRKIFSHLDQESFISQLHKHSDMLHAWRKDHYSTIIDNIYVTKDPLRQSFRNLKEGKKLVNQKFKMEIFKADVGNIFLQNKPQEAQTAAKKLCFSKIKTYISKMTDVIGAITELKANNSNYEQPEQESPNKNKRMQNNQSLPSIYKYNSTNYGQSSTQKKDEQNRSLTPLKKKTVTTKLVLSTQNIDSSQLNTPSRSQIILNSMSNLPSPKKEIISSKRTSSLVLIKRNQSPSEPYRPIPTQFSQPELNLESRIENSPSPKKNSIIRLNLKTSVSQMPSPSPGQEKSTQQSISPSPLKRRPSSNTPNPQQISYFEPNLPSGAYLENLFDQVIRGKNHTDLLFNRALNEQIVIDGLAKRNRLLHQSKKHSLNFSNLYSAAEVQSATNFPEIKEQNLKINILKKLKLNNILSYKYSSPAKKQPIN